MNRNNAQRLIGISQKLLSCLPLLTAIVIFEFLKVQITNQKVFNSDFLLQIVLLVQLIPCFLFAYMADKHYRLKALLSCHLLGLFCGIVFYSLGMEKTALVLLVITFTPLSVARAAILDNFSHRSYLKLLGITFLAQQIPWMSFGIIVSFPQEHLTIFSFSLIALNTLLIALFFKDKKAESHLHNITVRKALQKNKEIFLYTAMAFILVSLTMRMGWLYMEVYHTATQGIILLDVALMVGTLTAICYRKLPHMSVLTFCYSIGFGIGFVAICGYYLDPSKIQSNIFNFISFGSVVEGMAFPLALDALISMFGSKNKAIGSAITEMGTAIASFLSVIVLMIAASYPTWNIYAMTFGFLGAALLQMRAEQKKFQQD